MALRTRDARVRSPPARASAPSPTRRTAFPPRRNENAAKRLKRLDTAKSPASPRLRLSGESPAETKRPVSLSLRFVSPGFASAASRSTRRRDARRRAGLRSRRGLRESSGAGLAVHPATAAACQGCGRVLINRLINGGQHGRIAKTAPQAPSEGRGDATRLALIHAALDLFGAKGFEASSTRAVAAAAGANLGSIAYHFGGKQGLRLACADHVVETIRGFLGPTLAAAEAGAARRRRRRALCSSAFSRRSSLSWSCARRRNRSPASSCARCSSRPKPSSASTPRRSRRCTSGSAPSGRRRPARRPTRPRPGSPPWRCSARFSTSASRRRVALRRLGWNDIGPREGEAIRAMLTAHLHAALAAARGGAP